MAHGSLSRSFPPVADGDARVLILGSLPGRASLAAGQYYAQPRNAFWRIMGEIAGAAPDLPYAERTRRLVARGIALWDVCAAAHRPGSLDTAIRGDSVEVNDFAAFLADHPRLTLVCFNGAAAAALFAKHVAPGLGLRTETIRFAILPSTSPAHAAMPLAAKRARWAIIESALRSRDAPA